ncbi:zinc finger protein 266-like [Danaus plexippus]|uniref:zinc finger protein 266-like n=1 Tax=Danaus plexippus TaxID=13037 RepID=UPI002AAFBBB3|nr:zinc finger protein 266-like [Danaus plexippus]
MDLSNNKRCKCCLEERNLKDMWKEHYNEGQKEIYGFMIRYCFVVARFTDLVKKNEHEVLMHDAPKTLYECNACNRTVTASVRYNATFRFHLMSRPFKRGECGSAFFKRGDLQKHTLKHTGERLFTCGVCFKSYGRMNTLREHMRTHADDRRFECEVCGQRFVQKCSWRGHMRAKHGGL